MVAILLASLSIWAALDDVRYERPETQDLVSFVNDAAILIQARGEEAFTQLRRTGSRWRQGDRYIFVLDPTGEVRVHPGLEGKHSLELEDLGGRPIFIGLTAAAAAQPDDPRGWYHYEWGVPGGIDPRWRSSFVKSVIAPSGKLYVVGSSTYDELMERAFVVDLVNAAVGQIEGKGGAAFTLLRDPKGPTVAKGTYVFVIDPTGVELVNPMFPSLEGRRLLDAQGNGGRARELIELAKRRGRGWVDYRWPRPGESGLTEKSAYVQRAKLGDQWVMVGAEAHLAGARKSVEHKKKLSADVLTVRVREAAALLEQRGEKAYPELGAPGSKWLRDETQVFVWAADGTRPFHAPEQAAGAEDERVMKDAFGRPYGRRALDAASGRTGEGWVHDLHTKPGEVAPTWRSAFVKRVAFPSGKPHLVGCAVENMKLEKALVEDLVARAAELVAARGQDAFAALRDKAGQFVLMDAALFVASADGVERVNAAYPALEGRNILQLRDVKGKAIGREIIQAPLKQGSAWLEHEAYRPGQSGPARKQTFVRKVQSVKETYLVGASVYVEEAPPTRPSL